MPNAEERAKSAGRESLWKNARHTLGDGYFSFLKTLKDPAGTPASKEVEDISGSHSQPHVARREQIRRSQRTHRARTEQYVMGLESEVGRLRLAHADCVALVKVLHQKLGQYESAQAHHGAQTEEFPATTQLYNQANQHPLGKQPSSDIIQLPNAQNTYELLGPEAGLDFVMRLETPCLEYVRQDLASNDIHESTPPCAPAADAACAERRRLAREADPLAPMPVGADAERLLALSSRLDLGQGLMTPIQAWERIKTHPQASLLTSDKVQDITGRAQEISSCRRHGIVLDSVAFEELLNDILR